MSLRESSGAARFWTARRALIAGAAAVVVAAGTGTTVALTAGHLAAHHEAAAGIKTARLADSACSGPAGTAFIAEPGYSAFDAINTANCAFIQDYNVDDPPVPGDPGDYNYSSSPQGVALHGSTLYFADTAQDLVSVIDAATLTQKNYNPAETDIHVGINPTDLAVSPDGSQLWVADTGPQIGPGSPSDIEVVSTATDQVTATLRLPTAPAQVVFSPSGSTAYVTTTFGLWVFNTATDRVAGVIPGLGDPHGVAVSPDGSTVYVTNTVDNVVDVIDAATDRVTTTIPVGQLPWQMAVSADGSTVYVADPDSDQISVISTASNSVINTFTLSGGPITLALTPDGSELWVAGITSAILTVIDTSNDTVVGSVNLGGEGANSGDGNDPSSIVMTTATIPAGS
jgi:YVTN family beta-propeller protein